MGTNTVTIRELRTDFRLVKRRVEEYGEVIITDHGEPAYVIKSLPPISSGNADLPDYYSRLLNRQQKPISAETTNRFWEEERR